ncbi:CpXC domain-containing protein [Breznakiella homolactica]|uniref:Uncharacterized protein n=2 Tax=Breznakiella homolactica TaxID=2798577 RepID=A0A7T7XS15_9SPIR|nr:CpXC domain-containing protein [Breznakiella homolactica]
MDGKLYRKGRMHLATTADELEIQSTDEVGMNTRYRDIMLLSRVIDELEGISPVTVEIIENLFEADFLYLQLLYKELNGDMETRITATCPECGTRSQVHIPSLYEDMGLYKDQG